MYQAVVETSLVSTAQCSYENATENASNLIKDLQLVYNKVTTSITAEISEIVSGADAID